MPIYEYQCQSCGKKFEVWLKTFEVKEQACPECHSHDIRKLISAPTFRMSGMSEPAAESPSAETISDFQKMKSDHLARKLENLTKMNEPKE